MATIHQILTKSNTVGVTRGAGTVYPSCATQYTVFNWVHVISMVISDFLGLEILLNFKHKL
jgi:hypothetical protein